MAEALEQFHVQGLDELLKATRRFSKDLASDMIGELEEAAAPVRSATTQYMLAELVNVPSTPEYAAMRIGVARANSAVYGAPQWRSRRAGTPRPTFGDSIRSRMERAVTDKAGDVEKRMGDFLDRLADDWGGHLAA
jgi:hypothetical protein